jgi:hypothetical protein
MINNNNNSNKHTKNIKQASLFINGNLLTLQCIKAVMTILTKRSQNRKKTREKSEEGGKEGEEVITLNKVIK